MIPRMSVIIPTYNRAPILEETLTALRGQQEGPLPPWEVLVVDDGSTDATAQTLQRLHQSFQGRLRCFRQENKKQGAARNLAMQHAQGELFVFLGDDIVPSPGFLMAHWRGYCISAHQDRHALIGKTDWHPSISRSPFREWINQWGFQFGFALIENPQEVPFHFFYTSNLSFARSLYESCGGFDESFREYGWEDIELGYRFAQKGGMRLQYEPRALAYHRHYITVSSFCRRQFWVGYSAVRFAQLHSELQSFLHLKKPSSFWNLTPLLGRPVAKALELFDERVGWFPVHLGRIVLMAFYHWGAQEGRRDASRP